MCVCVCVRERSYLPSIGQTLKRGIIEGASTKYKQNFVCPLDSIVSEKRVNGDNLPARLVAITEGRTRIDNNLLLVVVGKWDRRSGTVDQFPRPTWAKVILGDDRVEQTARYLGDYQTIHDS